MNPSADEVRGGYPMRWMAAVVVAVGAWACASGPGGQGENRPTSQTQEWSGERVLAVHLASSQPSQAIPVIRRETEDRLRLSFDVAGDGRDFYTAHFHPTDRDWEISESPEDGILPPPADITDYEASVDLDFPYVQYRYEFPNSRVEFYRSGNFILRVVDENDQILIERRFYVSDEILEVEVAAKSSSLITDRPDELIPEARVPLPNDPWYSPNDCTVLFLKNGWADEAYQVGVSRVEGDAYVFEAPDLFRLTVPVYSTDLRGTLGIHRRDEITLPVTVSLLPDDMRFWGDDYRFSVPLPRSPVPPDPGTRYVNTQFLVQNGPGGVAPFLVGTFNDWEASPGYQLHWNSADGTYEISLPMREEHFFYTYSWPAPDAVRPQSKFEGPQEVVFTTIVYAKDTRYPTDRILAVKSQTLP